MLDFKLISALIEINIKLYPHEGKCNHVPIIGGKSHLPNIDKAEHSLCFRVMSRYMQTSKKPHLEVVRKNSKVC